jgi:hypothetical protein
VGQSRASYVAARAGAALSIHRPSRIQVAANTPTSSSRPSRPANSGVGLKLIERALAQARDKGHRLVVLVGDEPYYGKVGFKRIAKGRVTLPGRVDPTRLLVAELAAGAFNGIGGAIRPDWVGT